jgi:hypothetical protein
MLLKFRLSRFGMTRWQANNDGGNGAGASDNNANEDKSKGEGNQGDPKNFATFNDWYGSLTDEQKKLANPAREHFDRLYQTVRTVREERDTFQTQLKEVTKKMKEGSEERVTLEELSSKLDEANQRADFYEEAPSHKCLNPKAAYALALSSKLIDSKKGIDWKTLETEAPELFGETKRKLPKKSGAGEGSGSAGAKSISMNDWIRSQAGAGRIVQE